MKYLYEKIDSKTIIQKIIITDIEYFNTNNICFFQRQGTTINIDFDKINNYIENNELNKIIFEITGMKFIKANQENLKDRIYNNTIQYLKNVN